MKKKLIISSCVICGIIFNIIIFSLPYLVNDALCSDYRDEIEASLADVADITVLQVVNGCGNSSGTGDHTDLYVAALVKANLGEDVIERAFPDAMDIQAVADEGERTLAMELINLSFDEENYDDSKNLYIIEFSKRTLFSWLDLRGC